MKTVLVTGGAGGIGEAVCRRFAADGYFVGVCYYSSQEKAKKISAEIGGAAIQVDVTDIRSVERATNEFLAYKNKIDVLVNNAGIALPIKTILDCDQEDFNRIFDVNVKGTFNFSKAVLPRMLGEGGAIVNVSSMWGLVGGSCEVLYSASKAAVLGFTKALAKEYASSNVRINAVAPGFIETEMNAAFSADDRDLIKSDIPLGRFGEPKDVAEAIFFLADKAEFATGITLNISGGEVI